MRFLLFYFAFPNFKKGVWTKVTEVFLGRYFLQISYQGKAYAGWQSQNNAGSVQETLEKTLCRVFRQEIRLVGSSRTDAGVHAIGQIAQIDFDPMLSLDQCVFKINTALPPDIAVRKFIPVKPDAHCRFDAISRTYQYSVLRGKNPFWAQTAHFWYGALDLEAMKACCDIVLRHKDFQAFSKIHTQVKTFECKLEKAEWFYEGEGRLVFEVKANRFLRGMVRAMVGTMMEVGKGRRTLEEFEALLNGKDRKKAGESVPAKGLCLMEVAYPESVYLGN